MENENGYTQAAWIELCSKLPWAQRIPTAKRIRREGRWDMFIAAQEVEEKKRSAMALKSQKGFWVWREAAKLFMPLDAADWPDPSCAQERDVFGRPAGTKTKNRKEGGLRKTGCVNPPKEDGERRGGLYASPPADGAEGEQSQAFHPSGMVEGSSGTVTEGPSDILQSRRAGAVRPEVFGDRKCSGRAAAEWVAENLLLNQVDPRNAPGATAWGLLVWARSNENEFWQTVWSKTLPQKSELEQLERLNDDGRTVTELIGGLRAALGLSAGGGVPASGSEGSGGEPVVSGEVDKSWE